MSCGLTLASTVRLSASGTISMIASPAVMTPPTVWTFDWNTMPSCGARISTRLSWSSAVTLRSTNSPILPSISRVSLATSLLRSRSIWMICSSVSEILPAAWAVCATNCAGFALQPRRGALELGQLGQRDQLLLPQIVDAVLFALDQLGFLFLGFALRLQAANLLVELLDPLAKLCLLAGARVAAQFEQLALAVEDRGDFGIVGARPEDRPET